MVAGAIDRNICPEVGWPRTIEPLVIPRTKGKMFQSIAPETIK